MPSGGAVTNLSLATTESWKDKNTGQQQERTEWHRVVFFNRLAEIAGEYVKRGSKIYVEGSLRTRKWQDKDSGQDRYTTEIVANEMQMLDSKGSSAGDVSASQPNPSSSLSVEKSRSSQNPSTNTNNSSNLSDFDDDIPF